jgi:hypothetical protein
MLMQVKWVGVLASFIAVAAGSAVAEESCALRSPPSGAAVNTNHGQFFFIFPRAMDIKYTGCQTMWDEKGRKILTIRFLNGEPIKATFTDPDRGSSSECAYNHGVLISGSKEDCLTAENMKAGLPSIPKSDEPIIPLERDPRR